VTRVWREESRTDMQLRDRVRGNRVRNPMPFCYHNQMVRNLRVERRRPWAPECPPRSPAGTEPGAAGAPV